MLYVHVHKTYERWWSIKVGTEIFSCLSRKHFYLLWLKPLSITWYIILEPLGYLEVAKGAQRFLVAPWWKSTISKAELHSIIHNSLCTVSWISVPLTILAELIWFIPRIWTIQIVFWLSCFRIKGWTIPINHMTP